MGGTARLMSRLPEWIMLGTSLLVGVTMVMGINAINSAPSFMLHYYQYLGGSDTAAPRKPHFWNNVLSWYTAVTLVAQAVHEPTNLTSFMCRFSLLFRLELSCVVMLVELLVISLMPLAHTSELRAIAALMIVAYLGGAARAYFENTGYALFGPCPSVMLSGMLVGSAVSGALVSVVQILLKVCMSSTYNGVRSQSLIYFCVSMGIILAASVLLVALLYNPYAQQYVAEFRSRRSAWADVYRRRGKGRRASAAIDSRAAAVHGQNTRWVPSAFLIADEKKTERREGQLDVSFGGRGRSAESSDILFDARVRITQEGQPITTVPAEEDVRMAHEPATSATGGPLPLSGDSDSKGLWEAKGEPVELRAVAAPTTAEMLQEVKLWPVVQQVYPMMFACFMTFTVTYLMYPGVLLAADQSDNWFTTLIMAVYNFGDLAGRLLSMWKRLWPSRGVVVGASIVRILFIPLLLLCATHKIPSHTAPYIFTALMGLSNGFIGTLTMVYSPHTSTLSSDGERAMAGQLTGVCLLMGCSVGSLFQLVEVALLS